MWRSNQRQLDDQHGCQSHFDPKPVCLHLFPGPGGQNFRIKIRDHTVVHQSDLRFGFSWILLGTG